MSIHEAIQAYLDAEFAPQWHDKVRTDCYDVMTGNRAPNKFEERDMIPKIKTLAGW